MTSIFDDRGGSTPMWPTFRGVDLSEDVKDAVARAVKGYMFLTEGIQVGSHMFGLSHHKSVMSFELSKMCRRAHLSSVGPLYVLVALCEYGNGPTIGIVPHLYPQYPHVLRFDAVAVERIMFVCYRQVALAVYEASSCPTPTEVLSFLRKGQELYGTR